MKALSLIATICFGLLILSCQKEHIDSNTLLFPKVKSIIQNNCTNTCHTTNAGYNQGLPIILETDEEISSYAANIKAAVADPVTYGNKRMPENGALSQAEIDVIVRWFEKGGKTTD